MAAAPRPAPSVVSLFSGAGGLDVGLERAGWHTVLATDHDADCIATLTANQQARIRIAEQPHRSFLDGARIVRTDVADLAAADLRPPGVTRTWRPALLTGGPPCQPWSSAGLQRGHDDPRGQLFPHMVRLTDELAPRFVLFENVRGLVTAVGPSGRPGEALDLLKRSFEELGYATTFTTVNAADFGAAQRRVRLMMIATADHQLPGFPEPTHAKVRSGEVPGATKPWVSLAELLSGLPEPDPADVVRPTARRAAELDALSPGTGIRTGGTVESNRPGGHWGYRQDCFVADPTLPSRTIRAASTPDWVRGSDGRLRRLTWAECAALQGFPAEWRFTGTVASRFRQIGNAVQADVGEALGRVLLTALRAGPAATAPVSVPLPAEFGKRVRYTVAEHRTNGAHRVRVRAQV